jgi:hypothetical protein
MARKYRLPEPSGAVEWVGHVKNSYGTLGVYRVGGDSEVENPVEDVEYFAQSLANALAALEFENTERVDQIAALARESYYGMVTGDMRAWDSLSDEFRDRWRHVVRLVMQHVSE